MGSDAHSPRLPAHDGRPAAGSPFYILRQQFAGFLFLLPTLLFTLVFLIGPIAVALIFSFTKFRILSPPEFIGIANYMTIFKMPAFWESLYVTGKYIFLRLTFIFLIAFFMAHIVQTRIIGAGVFQTVYFFPYVFPLEVTSVVWKIFIQARGLMESFTDLLGIPPISWLTDQNWALVAILIATVWCGVGYYSIILLAGLQTIPKSVWEESPRARENATPKSELFEQKDGEWLDTGAAGAAGGDDSAMGPWEKSTGPRTRDGKAKVARNDLLPRTDRQRRYRTI